MTRNAADIAGVGAYGTLAAGKSADLVVWSGADDLTAMDRLRRGPPRPRPRRPRPPDDAHQLPPRQRPRRGALAERSVGRLDGPRQEGLHLDGVVYENALVVVKDGKIAALTHGVEAPQDALVAGGAAGWSTPAPA